MAPSGKTARDVARQATGAVPQIVNPAEELNDFAPNGLLRWSAVAGADAYEVWAYRDAALTQAAEFSGALSSRQYQFTELAGGQTYYVRLYFRANGVWREAPAFTLRTTLNVTKSRLINSQEELEAFGPSGTLRWTAVAGADVYELWIYRDAQRVAFAETSGPVRITQYQITSLTPGTTYYVQVYARVNGQFTAGGALPLTVTDRLDKARIVNPQEELDAFATNGILRWSPVTGATAYELWIFTNPNSSEIHESSGSLTTRSYQVRTLQPGKVYYAQAYALVNGQWQVGAPVKISTTATPTKARLSTPQEQLEGFATNGTLRWSEVPGATAYELWIYSNAGLGKIVESGTNPDRSYQVKRLCSGATYYVQVYALVNGVWTTGWATRLDVTQGTSAGDCIPPAPVVKLTSSKVEVFTGETFSLAWTSQFADSCTAFDGWTGVRGNSGQEVVGPLSKAGLFTLVCTNSSGSTKAQLIVTLDASFVRRNRTEFLLNGQPFRFTGMNIYNAASDGWCWYEYSDEQLRQAFAQINPVVDGRRIHEVVRVWFLQPLAIATDGSWDWRRFDRTLAIAKEFGLKVIPVLTDQWGECGSKEYWKEPNLYKGRDWYETGYKQTQPGNRLPYREWVVEVARRYANDPRVAFWQLINEAEVHTVVDGARLCPQGSGPADVLRAWASDVSTAIRGVDPNHLISLGTIGSGQCGAQGTQYQYVHDLPTIDICEYHDYGNALAPMPGDQWNGLNVRLQQCNALGKPLFVGEIGIKPPQVDGTLEGRAAAFRAKVDTQFGAGVRGALGWGWNREGSNLDDYDIGPGDPAVTALAGGAP